MRQVVDPYTMALFAGVAAYFADIQADAAFKQIAKDAYAQSLCDCGSDEMQHIRDQYREGWRCAPNDSALCHEAVTTLRQAVAA